MNDVGCARQHLLARPYALPDSPGLSWIQSAKGFRNIFALEVSALPGILIKPSTKLMIEKKLVIRSQLHHFSHQQISDPAAACPIMAGLRYVESDLQPLPSHPGLFPVLKFVSDRIAQQPGQRLHQAPVQAPIPPRRSSDGFPHQSAREADLLLSRYLSMIGRRVRVI